MSVIRRVTELGKATFSEFMSHKPNLIGAAIAFYLIFSLGPLVVLTTGFVNAVLGGEEAESVIIEEIKTVAGPTQADLFEAVLDRIQRESPANVGVYISVPLLLLGATMVFFQLKQTLYVIWGVTEREHSGIPGLIRDYAISFSMVFVVGALLVSVVVLSSGVAIAATFLRDYMPVPPILIHGLDFIVAFGMITVLFAIIYQILTDIRVKWKVVWISAVVTSFLFGIGQVLIGLYLSTLSLDSMYGAIGPLSAVFMWLFYSAQIFLFGAVFANVYSKKVTHEPVEREDIGN